MLEWWENELRRRQADGEPREILEAQTHVREIELGIELEKAGRQADFSRGLTMPWSTALH